MYQHNPAVFHPVGVVVLPLPMQHGAAGMQLTWSLSHNGQCAADAIAHPNVRVPGLHVATTIVAARR